MNAKRLWANPRYVQMFESVKEFFALGGKVHWRDLTPRAIGSVQGAVQRSAGAPSLASNRSTVRLRTACRALRLQLRSSIPAAQTIRL